MQLTINSEYGRLVPNLSEKDYDNLKNSIEKNGLWVTILVNSQGIILDGHNRYDICKELGIEPRFAIRTFENKLLEKKFVIECNLYRRHLNDFQKSELGIPLLEIEKELAKIRVNQHSLPSNEGEQKGEATQIVSKNIGVSKSTFERAKKIIEEAPEEVKENLREGKTTISKEHQKIQKQLNREKRHEEIKKIQVNLPDTIILYNQDFVTAPIKDNSISLIFTDPPYHEKYLPLFGDLSKHAKRVLREGGSLITYCGHFNIGKVINMMESQGLKFHWIISVVHSGPSASVFGRKILVGWKPMLWFTKGKYEGEFVRDLIKSEFQGKEVHEWAQSTVEADYYIKYLTIENEIVYDPFLGSGTFGVSAKKQNRQFIGCEIDKDHFENARRIISNAS